MILKEIIIYQLFKSNYIRIFKGGKKRICSNVKITNSKIFVHKDATIIIEEGCFIENADIFVEKGLFHLKKNSIILGERKNRTSIIINDGRLEIQNNSKVSCKRIWIRFGGHLKIGRFTNLNTGSEIRCDEKIDIGSFNQISYNVKIWDTNTHTILPFIERRKRTIEKFPYFGFEINKPHTKPVFIGNDCWIGENSSILKGSEINNQCIIGFGTMIIGKIVPPKSRVINKITLNITNI